MPVYEYECGACHHHFEEWQKMADEPVRTCPKCKKKKVERLISMTSFQLKGGGWYSDLYASKKPGGDKGGDAGGEGVGGGSEAKAPDKDTSGGSKDSPAPAKAEKKTEKTAEKKTEKKKDSGSKAAPAAN